MGFQSVEIELCETFEALDLIREHDKLKKIHGEQGTSHGHTLVAQIYGHTDCDYRFFLSGRVLNKAESERFAEILTVESTDAEEHF